MKTILITGSSGFIGKNLVANLKLNSNYKILEFDKSNSLDDLEEYVKKADFIYHLAGINRPRSTLEFEKGNVGLTEKLIKILRESNSHASVLFSSSIQAGINNDYGKSKRQAENALLKWAKNTSNTVIIYRLPNAFGKWSKPNYNSVVATFCYNVANNISLNISDPNIKLELAYIDDIIDDFIDKIESNEPTGFYSVKTTHFVTLSNLAKTIQSFKGIQDNLLIPNFSNSLTKKLYSTYTSFLNEDQSSYVLTKKSDERGWLAEFIKSKYFGQVFISITKPGFTRGMHWHNSKIEKFLVVQGSGLIKIRDYNDNKIITKEVVGENPTVTDMIAGSIHSITNIGTIDLVLLIWSSDIFNPDKPDTYFKEIDNE